ncbi:bifunctional pyr operon transcriptional regulator/uracil phosphoribosyltransferase PyrR [Phaeodactylibacter luteus]|uniref:Bifunctional pyr operon transcriptional regulator/uracil phosphoribosyltransferase PyrR n=1 Tax=Phaeodactylibacter luteus TaxID=1564516 RepID=A0A5C6RK44_9BACT|nr:bifunctional pyr operon transcriptional regulator/uracil phosphoribosyltransferase PyrR [Phaeodactylibacter luteus]TXB62563.1 bifunctional pyr operon transcriptional regulator/uracil phosphoribosyltransferase PyrR [Phaeodactylibacter luteus]
MEKGRVITGPRRFALIIERLCQQLIEQHGQFEEACLIGIQPRGAFLANRLHARLSEILGIPDLAYGRLDITFYRDDFRTREKPLAASKTEIDFLVEDKKVILVDDVLYTGRTVQAALTALNHYGRPAKVELVSMVDRRFNRHLPIQADYVGLTVDALDKAFVRVEWKEQHEEDQILIFADKSEARQPAAPGPADSESFSS